MMEVRSDEPMELRVLRYFLAVAREENISKAAQFLHVTQPTLSRQLMELEEQLDTTLFLRGNRKITLTAEGMFFRKRAQEIIDLVDKTESDLLSSQEILSGDIYIGSGESDAMHLIAQCAKELQVQYPNIHYHLFSGNADDVKERLDKGLIDFGILIEPADFRKYDYMSLPMKDQWGVLMRKDSPLSTHDVIKPSDLWEVPLITSRQFFTSNVLTNWIGKHHDELNIVSTYNLIFNASKFVEGGLGYALTLDKLLSLGEDSPLCFRPLDPLLDSGLVIVWKKYQIFSNAAEAFLKHLQIMIQSIDS